MDKYYKQLERIKTYLIAEGIDVQEVIRWQGGFRHKGTPYGLEVLATVIINGIEEVYCVPKYIVKFPDDEQLEPLKYLKIEKNDEDKIMYY